MKTKNICIIGATGFVGRNLTRKLIELGKTVTAPVRHPEKAQLPGAQITRLEDRLPFSGMDAVINLAGILHDSDKNGFEAVHQQLPERIAKACIENGVPRFLHMSALGASLRGPSRYLKSKAEGEEAVRNICENSSTSYTIFRPSVIVGENDHFISLFSNLMRLSPILPIACPDSRLQPILVDDVATAFSESLDMPQAYDKTLSLCGPEIYTLLELVRKIAEGRGLKRWFVPLPDFLSRLQASMLEFTPGPLMTHDNYLSLQVDNVCEGPFP
ncbi:MAG TPA: complex I NDUFA9 subunit family protein, partial [Burkholderiales bacterium]|nr:complex I NDUFA9 subunit family protein [Burkholderiales bacterium]